MRIKEALAQNKQGFFIDHRIILPFKCNIIKIMVGGDVITEMVGGKEVKLHQENFNTSIYFRTIGKLENYVGTYKVIKLIVAEMDSDLTDMDQHIKLVCEFEEPHGVVIHEPDDDMLFIE